jgi:hypothetical protein
VARHEQFWVVDGIVPGAGLAEVPILDRWPIDLRHW